MKKLILLTVLFLISCDFKDKNGNSPLIEDANGNLIDNPAYIEDSEYEDSSYKIEEDTARLSREKEAIKTQKAMREWADSAVKADKVKPKTKEQLKIEKEKIERVKRNFNIK